MCTVTAQESLRRTLEYREGFYIHETVLWRNISEALFEAPQRTWKDVLHLILKSKGVQQALTKLGMDEAKDLFISVKCELNDYRKQNEESLFCYSKLTM